MLSNCITMFVPEIFSLRERVETISKYFEHSSERAILAVFLPLRRLEGSLNKTMFI